MILLAMLLSTAQSPPAAAPPVDDKPIIVTAKSLNVTKRALDACIARKCPPDQEIDAALAHAENLFVEGEYRTARTTLHQTIGRVDKFAKSYPVAVSRIWRADSRIAAHLGERNWMQSGQFEAIDASKSGLARDDARILLQRLQVGDAFVKQGKTDMGRAAYRKVIHQARELNAPAIEGTAMLRIALFDAALAGLPSDALHPAAPYGSSEANYRQSRKSIREILDTTRPELQPFRDAARLLAARVDASRGDESGLEALAADYAAKKQSRVILLYQPMMKDRGTVFDPDRTGVFGDGDFDGQWVDLTFVVGADGRVTDAEVLRASPKLRNDWVAPVLQTIAGRRYAPIDLPDGLAGVRRVERYTMTSWKSAATTRTRLPTRSGQPRLEMVDLTAEPRAGNPG